MSSDPKQTAINLTCKGIEGIIRHQERQLADLDEQDEVYRDHGCDIARQARAKARPIVEAKIAHAREALRIRREAGGE